MIKDANLGGLRSKDFQQILEVTQSVLATGQLVLNKSGVFGTESDLTICHLRDFLAVMSQELGRKFVDALRIGNPCLLRFTSDPTFAKNVAELEFSPADRKKRFFNHFFTDLTLIFQNKKIKKQYFHLVRLAAIFDLLPSRLSHMSHSAQCNECKARSFL
jgi:hypothetical protein